MNKAQRKALKQDAQLELASNTARYPRDRLVEIPEVEWPRTAPSDRMPLRVWACRDFLVQEYSAPGAVRLSVVKTVFGGFKKSEPVFADGISWDQLQWIKDQLYPERMAVEIYPRSDRIVNVANCRHLWVLDVDLELTLHG